MNVELATSQAPTAAQAPTAVDRAAGPSPDARPETDDRANLLADELRAEVGKIPTGGPAVLKRILGEVDRVCEKSKRIQDSGQVREWQLSLARHRLQKCLGYYRLGSQRGRVDLHSTLSAIAYRHVAPGHLQMGFQARYTLIEDFMQGFYIEALRAFRRENQLDTTYQPRTRIELSEYLAFVEQYAKRRISLPGCRNQQLIVLRAKGFARRQPPELSLDIELAVESPKSEEAEAQARSSAMHQVREQMVEDSVDPADAVLRDRIVAELIDYLESQNQPDCIDYLTLKLQDLSAPEIDEVLGLTPRQRDYLQQRFKYHVERFARIHKWQLVHQWLGADLGENLGLRSRDWEAFVSDLDEEQRKLLALKLDRADDAAIAKALKCTTKQVQKRWFRLLGMAWQARNQSSSQPA